MRRTIFNSGKQILQITALACISSLMFSNQASAQLSSNPDKFLGNITTGYQVDVSGIEPYHELWNQITCENESKWGSVEGTRGSYNWGSDRAFDYAKQYGFTYKFHALVWGAQYPDWFSSSMSIKDRYNAIVTWFNAVKKKYPTLPMIDVVNEAVGMHQQGNPMMKESLGGGGKTGYDWLIKAFELAHERWPDAILIYNDYNTFQSDTDNYLELVRTLRDAGAPIDAYGCQSHDVNNISANDLTNAMQKLQNGLKMPMYITELDIDIEDDQEQKNQYASIFPLMWEADYCAGVTIWGYIHGSTWVNNSGIIKNGVDRPAMTWLRQYMNSEKAKTAKSPYPGMKKEASVYIHPAALKVANGDVLPILVRADMATETIEKVDLYAGSELIATMTEAPYKADYTATSTGYKNLKAVVTTTDNNTYERYSRILVLTSTVKREPYSETIPQLPGKIVMTEFDKGASGISYQNASRNLETTKDGAWMEYTVDVMEDGIYAFDALIASKRNGGVFHLAEYALDNLIYYSDFVEVPSTGSDTTYKSLHGVLRIPLTAGRHVLCLNVDKGGFYIKNISFSRYTEDKNIIFSTFAYKPSSIAVGDTMTITMNMRTKNDVQIDHIDIYVDNLYYTTVKEKPYSFKFCTDKMGINYLTAIAVSTDGTNQTSPVKMINVEGIQAPFADVSLPGTIEAENFDTGGEGLSFHDSDSDDEGGTGYRSDNKGVDIVAENGGYAIGYTRQTGEWLEYTVNVETAGEYAIKATVCSGSNDAGFRIGVMYENTETPLATVSVRNDGWNNYYTTNEIKLSEELNAGLQTFRITITGIFCNIDKIEFKCISSSVNYISSDDHKANGIRYNLGGARVNEYQKGIVIKDGKTYLIR